MKLLIYSHYFAPSVGGVETIVLSLAQGLAALCHPGAKEEPFEVTVVTQTPAEEFDDSSVPFTVVRRPNLLKLWRLVSGSDAVHVAGPSLAPMVLAWIAGKPFVVEHHGYQAICPNGILVHQPDRSVCPGHFQAKRYGKCLRCRAHEVSWPRSFISLLLMVPRHFLARRAAHNIAISRHVAERHALPRSLVLYYGIEDRSGDDQPTAASKTNDGKIRFAYVGRLVSEKGLPLLLDAAQILVRDGRTFELWLVGDGPQRAELEGIVRRNALGNTVRITGFLQGEELAEALMRVHVVVMPSLWEETAGLAAIEQMMRGRLVIASKIGGLGQIVDEAGLMFTPGKAESLAQCMRDVLLNPARITAMGSVARSRARELFLRDRMIAEHARLYRQVVREGHRPTGGS